MNKSYYKKLISKRLCDFTWHGKHVVRDLNLDTLTLSQLQALSFVTLNLEIGNGGIKVLDKKRASK